jgi:hypothetical protein
MAVMTKTLANTCSHWVTRSSRLVFAIFAVLQMNLLICPPTNAQDAAADRLVALCFYDIASEVCGFGMSPTEKRRLEGAKESVTGKTDSSIAMAAKTCGKLKDDVAKKSSAFCSPELKAYFYETLNNIQQN